MSQGLNECKTICPTISISRSTEDGLFYWQASDSQGTETITVVDGRFKIQQCQRITLKGRQVQLLFWTDLGGDLPGLWVCGQSYRLTSLEQAAESLSVSPQQLYRLLLRHLLPRRQRLASTGEVTMLRGLRADGNYPALADGLAEALIQLFGEAEANPEQAAAIETQLFCSGSTSTKQWLHDLLAKGSIDITWPSLEKSYSFRFPIVPIGDGFLHGYVDPDANACLLFTSHSGKAWILIDFDALQMASSGELDLHVQHHYYLQSAMQLLVGHILKNEAQLFTLYKAGMDDSKAIVSCRDFHVGHYLWNDLTGLNALDDLLASNPELSTSLRHVYIASQSIYCPLDLLFPHLLKAVPVSEGGIFDISRFTYSERCQYLRACDNHITAAMAERIRRYALKGAWLEEWGLPAGSLDTCRREELLLPEPNPQTSSPRLRTVLLYLRVNNRAAVNQVAFNVGLIQRLLEDGHATNETQFFICGSNIHSGMAIRSFLERADESPDWVKEQTVASQIIEAVKSFSDQQPIFSLVGASINHELLIADNADLIVTPWGAGMAKTKWVLNRPCFVHTSTWNLGSRNDLCIYEDTDMREDAVPDLYFPEECVAMVSDEEARLLEQEDPDGFALIKNGFYEGHPSRANYRLRIDASIDFICAHLPQRKAGLHPAVSAV